VVVKVNNIIWHCNFYNFNSNNSKSKFNNNNKINNF